MFMLNYQDSHIFFKLFNKQMMWIASFFIILTVTILRPLNAEGLDLTVSIPERPLMMFIKKVI